MNPLFTIGHSSHSITSFIDLLRKHQIDGVADVRSHPVSRHYPWFSRHELQNTLREAGFHYVFLGKELGARRDERECYVNGTVDYYRIAQTPAFHAGLDRLRKGLQKYRIAIMCAEKDPLDCHRTILVARHAAKFAEIHHILANGELESHSEAEARLLKRFQREAQDFFLNANDRLDDAYLRRGKEIAYVEATPNGND